MGKFTDRIKNAFRTKEDILFSELKQKHGLKIDAKIIPMDQMKNPHNAYVMRTVHNPRLIVHFENGEYVIREAIVMAPMWTFESGQNFIKETQDQYNLEMVTMDEAFKHFTKEEQQSPLHKK